MPNPKQPKKKIVDSLRKQEEKLEEGICCRQCYEWSNPVSEPEGPFCLNTKCKCHTPKVATSEKEWTCKWCGGTNTKKPLFGEPTPHESEDWEAEFKEMFEYTDFGGDLGGFILKVKEDGYDTQETLIYKLVTFIKGIESKAYQRGKVEQFEKLHERIPKLEEEAYQRGREYTMNDLLKQAEKAKEIGRQEVIALAVQEIRGCRKKYLGNEKNLSEIGKATEVVFNEIESIISGVMKK